MFYNREVKLHDKYHYIKLKEEYNYPSNDETINENCFLEILSFFNVLRRFLENTFFRRESLVISNGEER